ncbi:peptidyl-prolyl cis-trans isomerase [uncultured Tyzzerella sp.]|uniref:peptidyl-prolyl cis-trans isomerase n=1 Tax=uncultured Tyzzerella sp. TaxID=2321398 RepID=UPI0029436B27|nr:peptidyl-prolyl cis-trans isomerase [uncultured Tyzzerella sp.]
MLRYKKYINYILIAILILGSFSIYYFKQINKNKEYVLKINNEYIYKEEFLLYLSEQERIFEEIGGVDIWYTDFDGVPAKDIAKNNAINSIIFLKAIVNKAQSLDIQLTKEDENVFKEKALSLKENINIAYNIEIPLYICEKFEKEKLIEAKVYEYITGTFVVDEKDFQKYFENYMKKNNYEINKINLDYIFIKNNNAFNAKEKANNISKSINTEVDFNKFKEQPFIEVYKNVYLEKNTFEKNIQDKVYQLSENSISSVIEGRDGFYIFKINKLLKQDIKEIEKTIRDEYINIKKTEIYSLQTKNWLSDIKVQRNSEILSNI